MGGVAGAEANLALALDHSLVSSFELPARDWRKLTILVGAIAAVEALVILVAAVVLVARPVAHHLRSAALDDSTVALDTKGKTGPHTPAGKPKLAPAQTVVMVLNGNGQPGAAAATAGTIRGLGYRIGAVTNAQRMDYPKSVVMYRPGFRPEAMNLARRAGVKVVGPLDGIRTKRLGRAKVVYVVGAS